eukprot:165468-Prymnesium_polylepis.2
MLAVHPTFRASHLPDDARPQRISPCGPTLAVVCAVPPARGVTAHHVDRLGRWSSAVPRALFGGRGPR